MREVWEYGGLVESFRYCLGANLNCAACTMHWCIGEIGNGGGGGSTLDKNGSFLLPGEVDVLETVSHEHPSSEHGEGGWNLPRTSGENMSRTFRFGNQPRLVKLLSVVERCWISVLTSQGCLITWQDFLQLPPRFVEDSSVCGIGSDCKVSVDGIQLVAPPLFSPNMFSIVRVESR